MRPLSTLLVFIVLLLARPQLGHSQAAKGSIDGVVRDAKSNEPIPGARVSLIWSPLALSGAPQSSTIQPATDPFLTPGPTIPAATTDAQGKFAFPELEPNGYWFSVQANGYVRWNAARFGFDQGTLLNVAGGMPIKDLEIRLTPTGNVSGRVLDDRGEPAANIPVQLTTYSYNASGQRDLMLAGSTKTDDRGEYRLYFVAPGRYFIGAGTPPGPAREPTGTATNEVAELFGYAYYPNVPEVELAFPVEVQSGSEVKGIDMRLNRQRLYKVRGRVLDSRTGQPPASVSLSLSYRSAGGNGSFSSGQAYNAATGEFELLNAIPGSYNVVATVQTTPTSPRALGVSEAELMTQRQAATRSRLIAQAPVKIVNSDVEGLLLTVGGFSIAGRIRVEGQETSPALDPTRWRAQVRPVLDGRPVTISNVAVTSPTNPDGTFTVDSMVSGEYQVGMSAPPGFYLKESKLGDKDLLNSSVTLREASASTLELLLSPKAGQVDGTVVDDRGRPAEASQVVLIPDRNRDRSESFRSALVDHTGRFTVTSVPPGDYKLFAWESLEFYSFFDPEVLKRYEQLGKPVHVEQSSMITIEVPRIPSTP